MRLVAIALIAGCSSMPDVNGNTLGESGTAKLSVAPGQTTVNALGFDLVVSNTGDGASGAVGARLVDHDAAWFAITHTDCTELQPGGTCAVGVVFAPGSAATSGTTTLEIDDDNEPKTTAELDGKIMPAIRFQESAAKLGAQACTVAGSGELVSTTIHLLYSGLVVNTVQIDTSDKTYKIVNSCLGASGTMGSCDVMVQVKRGDVTSTPVPPATITATIDGLTATIDASYQLTACDLVVDPDPLMLDATSATGTITLTNRSTTNTHTLAGVVLGGTNNNTLSVPDSDCKAGQVLPPGGTCTANVLYTPSASPQQDKGSVTYTVTTSDAMPEPLAVTGTIEVGLANSHIHFEQNAYSWDDVTAGAGKQPMSLKVLTDNGVPMAGPLMISVTNPNAWVIDTGIANVCGTLFTTGCTFGLDFVATQVAGSYSGVVIAKGMNGELAYAALKAKVH